MPEVTNTDSLIDLIKRSELIGNDELAKFLAQRAHQFGGHLPPDHQDLANRFVNAGFITRWQMDQLLKGKYRGFRLGKYTLKGHLGTGGMSSVYLSEHPIMKRPVAIKVLPKSRVSKSSYLERFELEARAVAALDHPNIVRAYDIDNEGDTHYIVMEYVEGRDFQRMVEQDGPLDYEVAADYIAQAAVGLQHSHEAGLVHRDIKPANCLVDTSGVVKILDMGLAKFSQDKSSLSSVHKDSVVGTADYLAPEQAVNSSKVDTRADIYGLGGTLYFLLTGHAPFPEGTMTERLLKHQREEPTSVFKERPDAPAALVDICRRMMLKKREERIQTGSDVADELHRWLAGRGVEVHKADSKFRVKGVGSVREADETMGRWQQLAAATSTTPKKIRDPGETASGRQGDTRPMGSKKEEDLTLAPLDEEEEERRPVSGSSSDATNVVVHEHLNDEVLSQIEEEVGGPTKSTSGSLVDDLMDDPTIRSSTSTTGIRLPSRKPRSTIPLWMWGISAAAIIVVIGLFLAILLM